MRLAFFLIILSAIPAIAESQRSPKVARWSEVEISSGESGESVDRSISVRNCSSGECLSFGLQRNDLEEGQFSTNLIAGALIGTDYPPGKPNYRAGISGGLHKRYLEQGELIDKGTILIVNGEFIYDSSFLTRISVGTKISHISSASSRMNQSVYISFIFLIPK